MSASTTNRKANRLIYATSPYLLQHAYNPVDWFEWGSEALEKAVQEDRPILVSIGYSSCHWCHVMERESFENEDIALLMNSNYVCIKVDREERPDIDLVYMDAVHAMGLNGGWPLNVFLTPQQKPFYGGTYFQPHIWKQILENIHTAYHAQRDKVVLTANQLTSAITSGQTSRLRSPAGQEDFLSAVETAYHNLAKNFDQTWGGLVKAPKFVMPAVWLWLLRYYHLTNEESALQHINLTLTRILDGGIYDQVGGGFARYSVDGEWFVPHFEKMLYDNAQLTSLYAEAFMLTKNEDYKRAVYETVDWMKREMRHPEGAFYSALDADSEGVEGKFYCWTMDEIALLLGEDARLFSEYFGVTQTGNWEHGQNILKRAAPDEDFLSRNKISQWQWTEILTRCKNILLNARAKRIRPGLDDKILTGWNAMTICALADAYSAFGEESFLDDAIQCMQFLQKNLMGGDVLFRSFRDKPSRTEGFLEDYAYVIKAYLKLYQADFNEHWLHNATGLMEYTIKHFLDKDEGLFYFTGTEAEKLIARKKELFDNVIPSSNSLMAMNLHQLGIVLDRPDWRDMSRKMVDGFVQLIQSEPNYMSNWGIAFMELHATLAEVAIIGRDAVATRKHICSTYLPFAFYAGTDSSSELPLLKGKRSVGGTTTIYVCRNYSCKQPVQGVDEAIRLIRDKS